MIRRLALVAAFAMPLYLGCSAAGDERVNVENTGVATEALSGANGKTYYLESFNGAYQLIGLNDQGNKFTGIYGSQTRFKLAALDKFAPTDPCREPTSRYNTYVAVNDTVGFNAALTDLVTPQAQPDIGWAGGVTGICKARVHVDKLNNIVSFEPMP